MRAVYEAVKTLSPWTQHHTWCNREVGIACNCGLQEALTSFEPMRAIPACPSCHGSGHDWQTYGTTYRDPHDMG